MEKTYFAVAIFLIGLCLGSFVNAAVWRIKNKKNLTTDRSECTHCHYKLEVYDLIPVVSWLWLKGKCRKCKKPISAQYPIVELSVAVYFLISFVFWPYGLTTITELLIFGLWLLAGVGLAILTVYDFRWMILPDKVVFILIAMGVVSALATGIRSNDLQQYIIDIVGSLLVLSGFYLLLYIYSKGRWIGFGDVKLGIVLALFLANWQLALLALFLANVIGCLVIIPGLLTHRLKRTSHIPFGPFLIAGFFISGLFGAHIVEWYLAATYASIPASL